MENSLKLAWLYEFLLKFEREYELEHEKRPKGGARNTYKHASFILFFISVFLKRIFAFKSMAKYAKIHYAKYYFPKAPCRKTIRLRLIKMPKVIMYLMPYIAKYCAHNYCHKVFNIKWLFSDKSIFRAKGGIWHKKNKKEGIIPHPSIDTNASWAISPYHKWRFGFGLLIFTNENRFPVACYADTASFNEPLQAANMLSPFKGWLGILVGDAAYTVWAIVKKLWQDFDVLLLTKWNKLIATTSFEQHYKALVQTTQAYFLYGRRKPSVEPCFALIKELFNLKGESQLPYKGKPYVTAFLTVTAISIQLLMIYNFKHQHNFGGFEHFSELFR